MLITAVLSGSVADCSFLVIFKSKRDIRFLEPVCPNRIGIRDIIFSLMEFVCDLDCVQRKTVSAGVGNIARISIVPRIVGMLPSGEKKSGSYSEEQRLDDWDGCAQYTD
jgi:hypothetical protein